MIMLKKYTFSILKSEDAPKMINPQCLGEILLNPDYIISVNQTDHEDFYLIRLDDKNRAIDIYTDYSGWAKIRDFKREG